MTLVYPEPQARIIRKILARNTIAGPKTSDEYTAYIAVARPGNIELLFSDKTFRQLEALVGALPDLYDPFEKIVWPGRTRTVGSCPERYGGLWLSVYTRQSRKRNTECSSRPISSPSIALCTGSGFTEGVYTIARQVIRRKRRGNILTCFDDSYGNERLYFASLYK